VGTGDCKTIKLRIVDTQRFKMMSVTSLFFIMGIVLFAYNISTTNCTVFINKQFCPLFVSMNLTVFVDKYNCSIDKNTNDYLKDQVTNLDRGIILFENAGNGIKEAHLTGLNLDYMTIYNEWVENKMKYKVDYDWYGNMKSTQGHCPDNFNEKVKFSSFGIKNTPESISKFMKNHFLDWPQQLKAEINLEDPHGMLNDDDGVNFDSDVNGKISTNMYLIAWKREENDTIVQIQTYIIVFERKVGGGCHFNPQFWTGNRDKINNAKKYFLLTKVESNPVYKTFLIGIRRK